MSNVQTLPEIKVNELRVGSYINRHLVLNTKIEPYKVNLRFFSTMAGGRSIGDMKPDETIGVYFSPIPLSPEILVKSGFVFDNGDSQTWKHSESKLAMFKSSKGENLYVAVGVHPHSGKIRIVNFVHDLQNLHFALTQTELEITL